MDQAFSCLSLPISKVKYVVKKQNGKGPALKAKRLPLDYDYGVTMKLKQSTC